MKTLNANYKRNVDILKENLRRGMKQEQAISVINSMEKQFKNNNLYNEAEQEFINEMRKTIIEYFYKVSVNIA